MNKNEIRHFNSKTSKSKRAELLKTDWTNARLLGPWSQEGLTLIPCSAGKVYLENKQYNEIQDQGVDRATVLWGSREESVPPLSWLLALWQHKLPSLVILPVLCVSISKFSCLKGHQPYWIKSHPPHTHTPVWPHYCTCSDNSPNKATFGGTGS
jgi:hypothetical protein